MRRNNGRTNKQTINTKPDGVRGVGRPKLRWEDGVVQGMRTVEVTTGRWCCSRYENSRGHDW